MAGRRLLRKKSPTPSDFASLPVLCSSDRSKSEAEWVDGVKGAGRGSISEGLENPRKERGFESLGTRPGLTCSLSLLHGVSLLIPRHHQSVPRKEGRCRPVGSLQPRALLGLCLLPERACHLDLTDHPPSPPTCPHLPAQVVSHVGDLLDC